MTADDGQAGPSSWPLRPTGRLWVRLLTGVTGPPAALHRGRPDLGRVHVRRVWTPRKSMVVLDASRRNYPVTPLSGGKGGQARQVWMECARSSPAGAAEVSRCCQR